MNRAQCQDLELAVSSLDRTRVNGLYDVIGGVEAGG